MPTKDIKQKTTKRRSTSKSTENKRKVHRKSSTQLKKGGVIGQLYDPFKNRYEVNTYRHYDPKFVFEEKQNMYDLDAKKLDYSKPYTYKYTQPKLDIPSKIDVPYDHDKKWENNNNAYESDSVGVRKYPIVKPKIGNEMQKRIDKYLASADEIDENEYPRKRLESWGKQNAIKDDVKIPNQVSKKPVSDHMAQLMARFNNGGRKVKKVTKKQVVPKKKVTKKPVVPKKKVTKKPVVPKKKVTKK